MVHRCHRRRAHGWARTTTALAPTGPGHRTAVSCLYKSGAWRMTRSRPPRLTGRQVRVCCVHARVGRVRVGMRDASRLLAPSWPRLFHRRGSSVLLFASADSAAVQLTSPPVFPAVSRATENGTAPGTAGLRCHAVCAGEEVYFLTGAGANACPYDSASVSKDKCFGAAKMLGERGSRQLCNQSAIYESNGGHTPPGCFIHDRSVHACISPHFNDGTSPSSNAVTTPAPEPESTTSVNQCAGKTCGEPCHTPCPAGMSCAAVMSYCQADGECKTNATPNCSSGVATDATSGKTRFAGDFQLVCEQKGAVTRFRHCARRGTTWGCQGLAGCCSWHQPRQHDPSRDRAAP